MKINVNEIPKDGLVLEEISSGKDLDLERKDLEFNKPVKIEVTVNRKYDNVLIHLKVEANAEFSCSRCLEKGFYDISKEIDIVKAVSEDKVIDISALIRDEIILDYPIKLLCMEGCKGICSGCGNNLNKRQCVCFDKHDFNRGIELS